MTYCGFHRNWLVTHDGQLLDPGHEYLNHSPDGFCWGYEGSGPAQLAFAILLDYTEAPSLSLKFYQRFKSDVIAHLPMDEDFSIEDDQVRRWLEDQRKGHMAWGPSDVEFNR